MMIGMYNRFWKMVVHPACSERMPTANHGKVVNMMRKSGILDRISGDLGI
jgi:hypothetical protein